MPVKSGILVQRSCMMLVTVSQRTQANLRGKRWKGWVQWGLQGRRASMALQWEAWEC